MLVISPDAWAAVAAVIMVCITIVTVIAGKIEEKKSKTLSLSWVTYEVGTLIIAAYIAWQIHPHVTWMPVLVTREVFTILAIHGGITFIRAVRSKVTPS